MKEVIGKKIQKMRIEKGFSREELAEKLHISRSALERMENGKSNTWASQLENLSQVFEVLPEEFLHEKNNIYENKNQSGGMALQNNGTIETIHTLSEKTMELLDELISYLKKNK